jgi:hypothetical protein
VKWYRGIVSVVRSRTISGFTSVTEVTEFGNAKALRYKLEGWLWTVGNVGGRLAGQFLALHQAPQHLNQ